MPRRTLIAVMAGIVLLATVITGANIGMYRTIDYAVGLDAERKALTWAGFFAESMPEVAQLLRTGKPTPHQQDLIAAIEQTGDVFRFKLFDDTGRNVLVSDEQSSFAAGGDHSDSAAIVLSTGQSQVSLNDGRQKPDRPALYAEAYVPVRDADGAIIGVAEVYVDQSDVSTLFQGAFTRLSVILSLVLGTLLIVLFAGALIKNRQVRKTRSQVNFLATYDQLSNLYNRGGFDRQVSDRQAAGQIDPSRTAFVFVDIDHFKHINDTYGHKAGDAFLSHVGQAIAGCLGPDDIAGRLGGDEFVVVARCSDLAAAESLAAQLQAAVAHPLLIDGTTVAGNISMGIHHGGDGTQTISERMHRADLALYQAKKDGRGTYRVFTPELERTVMRRRKVESAVSRGLDMDLFSLHFQPLLEQKSRRCVGFEALLRLTDTDGTAIPPLEFIPVAESIGTIHQLGAWVLARAAEVACEWPEEMFVSVNLSARQFDKNDLVAIVKNVLDSTGLEPARLELEVTESLLMDNTESVGAQLDDLRNLGISIAMDDFGTGYSSLGYLWQFGFDKIKIDRSFILGLDQSDDKAREILDTIILLGHRLDMTVTAEGIENEQQASILSDLACDQFQGYLYARPMPATDLAAFMLNNSLTSADHAAIIEAPAKTGKGHA